jgi:hypothetical protein
MIWYNPLSWFRRYERKGDGGEELDNERSGRTNRLKKIIDNERRALGYLSRMRINSAWFPHGELVINHGIIDY